jgi:hypothetical protein
MTKAITIIYQASHHHRERIFAVLVTAIVVAICAYVMLLQMAIVNVVQREKVSAQVKSVSANVGGLEEKYFTLKNGITLELAKAKGLKNAENISYISKKPVTAMIVKSDI